MAVGLVLLLGFALPPLLQLQERSGGARDPPRDRARASGGVASAPTRRASARSPALLIWQAGDLKLGVTVVGGFAAAVLVFFVVAWGAAYAASRPRVAFSQIRKQDVLRYGLANLRRHSRSNAVQVASLALGLTAVLLLTFTRNDLVDAWRRTAPPDAPNRFVVGVQPDQIEPVKDFFASRGIAGAEFNPMVRGRLVGRERQRRSARPTIADERAQAPGRARIQPLLYGCSRRRTTCVDRRPLVRARRRRRSRSEEGIAQHARLEARRPSSPSRSAGETFTARSSPRCASCAGTRCG